MESIRASSSIHVLQPLEIGGVEARRGFSIQDHVGVKWCLELLTDQSLKEVWFENQDDITLIWECNDHEEVEFVQVKSAEIDQLWSVAKLCERKRIGGQSIAGTSVIERSLAYDRCIEPCYFRLVTIRPVQAELRVLKFHIGSHPRNKLQNEINELIRKVGEKVGDFRSENNNGHDFWISKALWEVIHSLESIKDANRIKLINIVQRQGEFLSSDQIGSIYEKLLTKVYHAALTRWTENPQGKKFKKTDFSLWFSRQLQEMINPPTPMASRTVQKKMGRAGIADDAILTANDLRRRYREELLRPQYLKVRERRLIMGEVTSILQTLRSQLDAGLIEDSGIEFHARCLRELGNLRDQLGSSTETPLALLQGYMYDIVGRCLHRFLRADL